ncbi:sensor histidine kinase [Aureibacter tunicatorum]|uniref:histidine kinase n=1 Tax=Aureibacter tunicatorum TaxID=866807 RepID=A0AAE3XPN3_9BACT|nr:ATP-binding protein [Aureibacter tunicatorum]MDR6239813.1 signal transduction histidine kinase [Aureibacter tunicatorum]BDD04288.1 hypothetical protein AUTU_17710 [Aureibacter tunicatorum]
MKRLKEFDSVPASLLFMNSEGQIEEINAHALSLFHQEETDIVGHSINNIFGFNEKYSIIRFLEEVHDELVLRKEKVHTVELTGLRKGEKALSCNVHISLFESDRSDAGIPLFVLSVEDVTALRISNEKLKRYTYELERSNIALEEFAYISSHDLQEPLRKIQAFGDRLLQRHATHLTDQGKDYLARMLNAASRMRKLINGLLSYSRVANQQNNFQLVDLNSVIREVFSDLEVLVEQNHAKINTKNLPKIEGDPTLLRQLFQNLIANAIKFKKSDQEPVVSIEGFDITDPKANLKHQSVSAKNFVVILVEDNGIGFNTLYQDKIFQLFQRLEGNKHEGSGIGLAICRKIAQIHGGDIEVESQEGKGTIFKVILSLSQLESK